MTPGFGPRPLLFRGGLCLEAVRLRQGGCRGPGAGGMKGAGLHPSRVRRTPWEEGIWMWGSTEEVTAER